MKCILGFYSQIPQCSNDEELEKFLDSVVKPLLTLVYQNKENKIMLRFGVGLFEWFEKKHPEINMLINDLCSKGQIELLASSYYDAMIPIVPIHERSLHYEKTITYIRKKFHQKVKGLWFNNQVFTPSAVTAMGQCGLDYVVISSFSQSQNSLMETKPFYLSEMGRETVVFPFDDKYSKLIREYSKNTENNEKFIADLSKLADTTVSSKVNTIMINLDQLSKTESASCCLEFIFKAFEKDLITCSEYINDHEITKESYIPAGVYGRDFSLGKSNSINQKIVDVPLLNRYSRVLDTLRDVVKELKKNSDFRNSAEAILLNATNSSILVDKNYLFNNLKLISSKPLCDAEALIAGNEMLPSKADIDGDRIPELIACQKSYIAYLNTKGGSVSRLNLTNIGWDLCFNNSNGIFIDVLRNNISGKATDLSSRRYDLTAIDRKGLDYFAKSPVVEIGKNDITITKRYKFRQSSVIVDVEIENLSDSSIKDYTYECVVNIGFINKCDFTDGKVTFEKPAETQIVSAYDKPYFGTVVHLSEPLCVSSRIVFQDDDINGNSEVYQYTQLKIQKKLTMRQSESQHITITLKFDNKKENKTGEKQ